MKTEYFLFGYAIFNLIISFLRIRLDRKTFKNIKFLINELKIKDKELSELKTKEGIDEYAKQVAEAFHNWTFHNESLWIVYKPDQLWGEYQKSKLKK